MILTATVPDRVSRCPRCSDNTSLATRPSYRTRKSCPKTRLRRSLHGDDLPAPQRLETCSRHRRSHSCSHGGVITNPDILRVSPGPTALPAGHDAVRKGLMVSSNVLPLARVRRNRGCRKRELNFRDRRALERPTSRK